MRTRNLQSECRGDHYAVIIAGMLRFYARYGVPADEVLANLAATGATAYTAVSKARPV